MQVMQRFVPPGECFGGAVWHCAAALHRTSLYPRGQGSTRMAVHRRRRGGTPPGPPPPPDQSDHRGRKRNLPLRQSGWAIFGTLTFAPLPSSLPEAAALGQGCQGQGQGQGQGGSAPPPGAAQPPLLPPWAGRAGAGARQCDTGGQGSAWGRPSGAPRAAQGCGSPSAAPRGGALEPGLHSASAVIGRGGRPTPHSRTCICGRGWGSAQPEIWAGTLLRGSHIGRRPRSFRRAAIHWGGRVG